MMKGQIDIPAITTEPVSGVQGGTKDYEKLENLPKINEVEIKGELHLEDLGLKEMTETKAIEIGNVHIHNADKEIREFPEEPVADYCYIATLCCSKDDEIMSEGVKIPHNMFRDEANKIAFGDYYLIPIGCNNCDYRSSDYVPKSSYQIKEQEV